MNAGSRPLTKRRKLTIIVILLGLLGASGVLSVNAAGHSASKFYTLFGEIPASRFHIPFYFDSGFPSGRPRSRMLGAARSWNKLGRKIVFVGHRPSKTTKNQPCQNVNGQRAGVVRWGTINGAGGVAANTGVCIDTVSLPDGAAGYHITGFKMTVDSKEDWYFGTGQPGEKQIDFWGSATHELGHATGWGPAHFDPFGPECLGADIQTMCGYKRGSSLQRTLGSHDIDTMKKAIGAR